MPATFARPELLASPDWLAEHLSRPGIRVVDCRYRVDGTGRQVHAAGHIPGAVHLDWAHELIDADDPLPFQLAGPEEFAAAMSRARGGDWARQRGAALPRPARTRTACLPPPPRLDPASIDARRPRPPRFAGRRAR